MNYRGIKRGDQITFKQYAGRGLNGPEYKEASATVKLWLIFAHHVVVNSGPCGTVVDDDNIIAINGRRINK